MKFLNKFALLIFYITKNPKNFPVSAQNWEFYGVYEELLSPMITIFFSSRKKRGATCYSENIRHTICKIETRFKVNVLKILIEQD